jgi:phosphoribosylformimino-5-aminoimidazole carboxamide ribotide isomerase
MALEWQSRGAPRLHIVDLDGAAKGEVTNLDIITEIARAVLVPTQLGGGIRRIDTVEQLLKAGIERVILGTAAVEDPQLIEQACRRFRESVIVSIDARDGYLATRGWLRDTNLSSWWGWGCGALSTPISGVTAPSPSPTSRPPPN